MPWKPKVHRTTHPRPQHRLSACARGYDREWNDRIRPHVLARDCHLCRHCFRAGRLRTATEVDHMTPHKGKADPLYRDLDNLQSLCSFHHKAKSAMDATRDQFERWVICGPPGSGKTTYVRLRARPGDLVWDWDEVMAIMTRLPIQHRPPDLINAFLAMRDGLVQGIRECPPQRNLWLIVADKGQAMTVAEQLGAKIVDLGKQRKETKNEQGKEQEATSPPTP